MDKVARATARERVIQYFVTFKTDDMMEVSEIKSKFRDIPKGTISSIISQLKKTGLFSQDGQKIYKSAAKEITVDDTLLALRKVEERRREKKLGRSANQRPRIDYNHTIELAENLLAALRVTRQEQKKWEKVKELIERR